MDNRVFLKSIHDLERVMQDYIAENVNNTQINH